jgi:hypothetical protein
VRTVVVSTLVPTTVSSTLNSSTASTRLWKGPANITMTRCHQGLAQKTRPPSLERTSSSAAPRTSAMNERMRVARLLSFSSAGGIIPMMRM